MSAARNLARSLAESMIVRSGAASLLRRRLRGRAVVLAYHNIVPTGMLRSGESSLHLPQAQFARHLDVIASAARVVPLESLFDDGAGADARRVAITFDDAYAGALTAGLDELRRRSMPATIFVAPGLLGQDVWWDHLAGANRGVIPDDERRYAIHDLRGDREAVMQWFAPRGDRGTSAALPRIASEPELAKAAAQPGITFGAHSWSHRNMSALSADELDAELSPPLAWLRARYTNTVPWLAYPYGIASTAVERAAERAGLRGAFLVSGGWLDRYSPRLYALPRISVSAGLSPNGLSLRLAGIVNNR